MSKSLQAPSAVVMVRPHHFQSNPETMGDNAFQRCVVIKDSAKLAYDEVSLAAETLREQGVTVHVFEDETQHTPDSVFPNNWFTTHSNGTLITYPMYAPNRRLEYRQDIIEFLQRQYGFLAPLDLRQNAERSIFLEGTGSIVFDHVHRLAYAARSKRTHPDLLHTVCGALDYQAVLFDAQDRHGVPVYHTNVLMCVGTSFVMICMDMVAAADRARLKAHFEHNHQQLIDLSEVQIQQFCGNALELMGSNGPVLALSETAFNALSIKQREDLSCYVDLVPLRIPTIEAAGGSVRCMLAGVHQP